MESRATNYLGMGLGYLGKLEKDGRFLLWSSGSMKTIFRIFFERK